jgi:hypothetical protein
MDKYIIFGLLIVMALLLIIHLYRKDNINEKFANPELPNLQSCPASLNKYTSDVSINCCEGPVVQGKCQGEPVCTLSEKTDKLPRCIDWYRQYLDRMSKRHCPITIKNFYEDESLQKIGFCTESRLDDKLRKPLISIAQKCNVHQSNEKNIRDPDSCLVRKMMAKMVTPDFWATREVTTSGINMPVILISNYMDEAQSKTCYDRPTVDRHLDVALPGWRSNDNYKPFYRSLPFCDTAKRRLDARKEDPNYRSPIDDINVDESRRFNFRRPRFGKRPRFGLKFPKFSWKPKRISICRR